MTFQTVDLEQRDVFRAYTKHFNLHFQKISFHSQLIQIFYDCLNMELEINVLRQIRDFFVNPPILFRASSNVISSGSRENTSANSEKFNQIAHDSDFCRLSECCHIIQLFNINTHLSFKSRHF